MDFIIIYLYYPTFFDKMTIINSCKSGPGKPHCSFIYTATSRLMDNTSMKVFYIPAYKTERFPGKFPKLNKDG